MPRPFQSYEPQPRLEFLAAAKAFSNASRGLDYSTAANDRSVAADPADGHSRTLAGGLGDKIHGTADAIGVHIRLKSFIDLNGFDEVGRNGIEFNLAARRSPARRR
jgi:hypothetical protein